MSGRFTRGPSAAVRFAGHVVIRQRRARDIWDLAGLVAEGMGVKEAGVAIGISPATATVMMRELRLQYDGVAEEALKSKGRR